MIKSYRTAQILARELLAQAGESEPNITADLQMIAKEFSAEMVGLDNRFKTEESLTRKLIDKSYGNSQKLSKIAKTINDVLRYTFILPIKIYYEVFQQIIEKLLKFNYEIPEHKIWNAWQAIGSEKDRGYRGINITIISSQKQIFELQFHTEESFELKTETHELYTEARLTKTLPQRREEIKEIVLEKAEKIKIPGEI